MPVYEYRCRACGEAFERFQAIREEPVRVCPHCGRPRVERLISRTSFALREGGCGWAAAGYAPPPPKEA